MGLPAGLSANEWMSVEQVATGAGGRPSSPCLPHTLRAHSTGMPEGRGRRCDGAHTTVSTHRVCRTIPCSQRGCSSCWQYWWEAQLGLKGRQWHVCSSRRGAKCREMAMMCTQVWVHMCPLQGGAGKGQQPGNQRPGVLRTCIPRPPPPRQRKGGSECLPPPTACTAEPKAESW